MSVAYGGNTWQDVKARYDYINAGYANLDSNPEDVTNYGLYQQFVSITGRAPSANELAGTIGANQNNSAASFISAIAQKAAASLPQGTVTQQPASSNINTSGSTPAPATQSAAPALLSSSDATTTTSGGSPTSFASQFTAPTVVSAVQVPSVGQSTDYTFPLILGALVGLYYLFK